MKKIFIWGLITSIFIIASSLAADSYTSPKVVPNLGYPLENKAPITSGFGMRYHPRLGVNRLHAGIDLAAEYNTPILATHDGVVEVSDFLNGYGYTVVVRDHSQSFETLSAHMNKIMVKKGEQVKKGQVIGLVGSSGGVSTGPHLHWETRKVTGPISSIAFNPLETLLLAEANLGKPNNVASNRPINNEVNNSSLALNFNP